MATETQPATHTPTPWRRGKASDAIVADAPVRPFDDAEDVAYYGGYLVAESVTVANQEFIVRACNAHDELVAALKRAVETIRAFHGIDLHGPHIEEHAWTLYQQSPEMKAINATLAKAEGAA